MNPGKYRLEITVFIAGAVVMLVELTGSRLLAPFVGTSIYVWTNLIGVIMMSLSLGYWWGGRLARSGANYPTLSKILFWSGVSVGLTYVFHQPVLSYIEKYFTSLKSGAFMASLVLFAPSSVLLGTISPYAVSLKVKDLKQVGVEVGNLYALSTMGSIAGTFLTGYVLISMLGSSLIMGLAAAVLLLLSLFTHLNLKKIGGSVLVGILLMSGGLWTSSLDPGVIDVDTQYSRVRIMESKNFFPGQTVKLMVTGNTMSSGTLANGRPAFPYISFYKIAGYFNENIERALVIGGAGYTLPMELSKNGIATDVVEIDPGLTVLAEKYFGLKKGDGITVYHEDGRTFMNRAGKATYDAIYMDAFGSYVPPFQLTTVEMLTKMHQSLSENGVVLVNVISTLEGDKGKLLRAQYRTYGKVFPYVYVFPIETKKVDAVQNIMLVASKTKEIVSSDTGEYKSMLAHLWNGKLADDVVVLTDNFAPVEAYGESFF